MAFYLLHNYMDFIEIEKHYLVIFFSNAAFGLLQEWINNGQKESPEELVRILNKIVPYKFI